MEDKDITATRPDALSAAEVLEKAKQVGVAKAGMGFRQSFVLAVMAGLFIGMGGMFMLLVKSDAALPYAASQLLGGLVFCLGLFLVVAAGAELFTGNCLMVCARLFGRLSWNRMLRSWLVVYAGNLVGSLVLVGLLFFAQYHAANSGAVGDAMITVATAKAAQPWGVLFFKGVMCNFLVCLAVWVGFASRTIIDKFVAILLPITAFVACGFEHCVANMFFLPMGLVLKASGFAYSGTADASQLGLAGVLCNLSAVTLGNIVGGAVLVGVMYWAALHKKGA
jgi:formate/nitrite transporter